MNARRAGILAMVWWLSACAAGSRAVRDEAVREELGMIATLEARRELGAGKLESLAVGAGSAHVRARALLALARLQHPATAATIARALSDRDAEVRRLAAFAAGALGMAWQPVSEEVERALVAALVAAEPSEKDAEARRAMLEALGKLRTAEATSHLGARVRQGAPELSAQAALSLGLAAKAGASLPEALREPLQARLAEGQTDAQRYGAAYALAMAKWPNSEPALLGCARDPSSLVRALCVKGLAASGSSGVPPGAWASLELWIAILRDEDPRVAVEGVRALVKAAASCVAPDCPVLGPLAALVARVHVVGQGDTANGAPPLLALAQAGTGPAGRELVQTLRSAIAAQLRALDAAGQHKTTVRRDLGTLDCRLAAALDRIEGRLAKTLRCGGGQIPEQDRLALGLRETTESELKDLAARLAEVAPYLRHPSKKVRSAAIAALGKVPSPEASGLLRPLLHDPDLILAINAAAALAEQKDGSAAPPIVALAKTVAARMPDGVEPLADALVALKPPQAAGLFEGWLRHPHAHVRSVAGRALGTLRGAPVEVPWVEPWVREHSHPPAPAGAKLRLVTAKGEILIRLFSEDAPLTTGNLWALAGRGYFKDTTFHRIVPDFVAQGGDPRGDGEGGPGYTIPCEVNLRRYERGTVGMALAGRDTGGSQFFITHTPTPHLDGRYTVFGQVEEGMEVVDALLEGDVIVSVEQVPPAR